MIRMFGSALAVLLLFTSTAFAQDHKKAIKSAMSAGPPSISADATVLDWELNVLHEGTNDWVCLPDRPDTEATDPWCVEGPWIAFLQAFVSGEEPEIDRIGFAYMLQGDAAVSNSDPMATEPTGEDDWVTGIGGHMMIIVPDPAMLEGISTDHRNGGPWVMWPNTPYAHIMAPTEDRWAGENKGY
ncbi:MAG: hypothetical protein M8866_12325 [marine benthic group bacterium]|jgi:hypothetical protein|nr:hypothetical protein [Candidatus Benthicola marisminoris]